MTREWTVGTRLDDRWEIYKVMRGGMGMVYVVHDHASDEVLAAKTWQSAVFARDASIAPMFTREALTWVRMDAHPNIAQALFVQEIEGRPVLFLEYVSGGDLSDWIGTTRLTEDIGQVLRFAIAFCNGMIHARSKGIEAHCGIKPQNCLITEDGTLKITDFGLAVVPDDGAASGTCTHMPPEQFDDATNGGVRADVYSFGVILYQMLTGRLPFSGRTWHDLKRQHREEVPSLQAVLPPMLRDVLARCLAKDPAERWPDFEQLRAPLAELYEQGTGTAAPQPSEEAELDARQWLNKGVALAALGLSGPALRCYERALGIDPGFAEVWSNKGALLRSAGRLEDALTCYEQAITNNPAQDLAWYNKGATLEMLGRYQEAVPCLEQALRINPLLAEAWSSRGKALDKLGQRDEALASYQQALQIHPRFTAAWANLGNLLQTLGRLEDALHCHDAALSIHPMLPDTLYNRANVLVDMKRHEEALSSYGQALEVQPEFSAAWMGKGNALAVLERHEEAIACFEKGLEQRPRDAYGWYSKAIILEKLGRLEEALEAFERSLECDSRDAEIWVRQGGVQSALERPEEAHASYVAAISVNPRHAAAWQNRAVVAKRLGRTEEALTCHDRAIELDPQMEHGLLDKANLLAEMGRTEEALAGYDRLFASHPQSAAGWFGKGVTLGDANRYEEAVACFQQAEQCGHPDAAKAVSTCRQAIEDAPPPQVDQPAALTAEAWHNRGAEFAEQGRQAEAIFCFEQALAMSPQSATTWYGKAAALAKLGHPDEAIAGYDQAIAIHPDFAAAWYSKGVTLVTAYQRHRDALACFERAHQLGYPAAEQAIAICRDELAKPAGPKEEAAAWNSRGAELEGQGQLDDAMGCFDRALAIYPEGAESWYGKAVVLGKLGRSEEELACYDQALWIAPGFAAAWFNKGRTLGGRFRRYREAAACFEQAGKLGHPSAAQAIAICQKALAEEAAGSR